MTKIDEKHPDFIGKVLCSRGIGAGYIKRPDAAKHKYKKGETIETYRLRNGVKINLPTYYRNKLFTEKERELLFIDKIDKGIIYVLGTRVHRDDEKYYIQLLEEEEKYQPRIMRKVWLHKYIYDVYWASQPRNVSACISQFAIWEWKTPIEFYNSLTK